MLRGLAYKKTIRDIANMHKKPIEWMKIQLQKGIKVEMEHTKSKSDAKKIAMDHLFEHPNYYIELEKMEKKLKCMNKK